MRRLTMADIRHASLKSGSPYFERATTRYWGPEKFWGPYEGPGGVYFVKKNKAGISIEKFHPDSGRIHNVASMIAHVEDARDRAKELARSASRDPARSRRHRDPSHALKAGEPVEVQKVWAGGRTPLRSWSKGYVFVRMRNPSTAVVRHTEGMYKGIEVNYAIGDVRHARANRDPSPLSRSELKARAAHHPHAWQVWALGDRYDREGAHYVNAFADKGEAERLIARLRRSHPGVRYELRRKRVEPRMLFGPSGGTRRQRRSEASFKRRVGR